MMSNEKIAVVGAGLCGTLLALRLAQHQYQVDVYERRSDMRRTEVEGGRSINLALSHRGLKALRLVGLVEEVLKICIPMHGRLIHDLNGNTTLQRYSGREGEWINSVSRSHLNRILIEAADQHKNLNLFFDQKCLELDLEKNRLRLQDLDGGDIYTRRADLIFGTDGAGSPVRKSFEKESNSNKFEINQAFLSHGYKELCIPANSDGSHRIEKNVLHIWPRGSYMLIALPNMDGSFTVTLFLPYDAQPGFNQIKSDDDIQHFFSAHFPDAVEHMPDLVSDFNANPTGSLGTVKCYPWQYGGQSLLMGDAAHAIVPFYGQGMNCAFEDVSVLDKLIEQKNGDWTSILNTYQEHRKPDTDAIADLALENYIEMRDQVADPKFALKRKIELRLENEYPDYFSKYSLVTFQDEIPYREAAKRGHTQNNKLLAWCANQSVDIDVDNLDLGQIIQELDL